MDAETKPRVLKDHITYTYSGMCKIIKSHNTQDLDLKLHHCENLKSFILWKWLLISWKFWIFCHRQCFE